MKLNSFLLQKNAINLVRGSKNRLKTRKFFWKTSKETGIRNPYLIDIPKKYEYPKIVSLMWTDYFCDEPTASSLGFGIRKHPLLEQVALVKLSEGLSQVARCIYTGDIIGASINCVNCPWDPIKMAKMAAKIPDPKLKSLLKFQSYVQRTPQLWKLYDTNRIFEISKVFVRKDHRRKGLAYKLIRYSRDLGADCGHKVIRVNSTNYYMSRICEKMDMNLVYTIPYYYYVSRYGDPIFKSADPHKECKVFIDVPH